MSLLALLLAAVASLLLLPVTGASAAKDGKYVGKDEGEAKVVLKVKNDRVVYFSGSPWTYCGGDYGWLSTFAYPPAGKKGAKIKIKKSGLFAAVFKGSPDISYADDNRLLSGTFQGRKVKGSMKIQGLCSADSKFKATLRN